VRRSTSENDLHAFFAIEEAEQDRGLADFGPFNILKERQLVVYFRQMARVDDIVATQSEGDLLSG